ERLNQTATTQPALFVIEYSLAKLWMALGLSPRAFIGHSIGEYVAACLSGVFTLADALKLVAARGRLIQSLPGGAMLSVPLAEPEITGYLSADIALAAVNAPNRSVVSGPEDAIGELETRLRSEGVQSRRLVTSHAFHSRMMDPIVDEFTRITGTIKLNAPQVPYLSNVTGAWISEAQATDASYWAAHLRHAVRFDDGVSLLLRSYSGVLLEVGPGRTLTTLAAQRASKHPGRVLLSSLRPAQESHSDIEYLLKTVGKLWLAGVDVRWEQLQFGQQRNRLALPTYPFERKRYWIEASPKLSKTLGSHNDQGQDKHKGDVFSMAANQNENLIANQPAIPPRSARRNNLVSELKIAFKNLTGIETESMDIHATFFELGADSLLLVQISQLIQDRFNIKITFRRLFEDLTTLDSLAGFIETELPEEALEEFDAPAAPPARQEVINEMPIASQHAPAPPKVEARQCALRAPAPAVEQGIPQATPRPAPQVAPQIAPEVAPQQPARRSNGSNGHAYPAQYGQAANVPEPLANSNSVERIFNQQLQVMSQIVSDQISALRYGAGSNGNGPRTVEQETVEAIFVETREPGAVAPVASANGSGAQAVDANAGANAQARSHQSREVASKDQPEPFIPYKPLDVKPAAGLSARQQEYLNAFTERYTKRTAKSKALAQAARPRLADTRLSSNFRSTIKELVYPIYCERSADSRVWDVDGHEYVDLAMGYGVHL
ncbi:MAG TPA: acyltransferase domain-containing protein, partial [Blastocatellia bacterium]